MKQWIDPSLEEIIEVAEATLLDGYDADELIKFTYRMLDYFKEKNA